MIVVTDLDFAKRCLHGEPSAVGRLSELIDGLSPCDEVRQAVRYRLLVDRRLGQFDGRSSLYRWLKTMSTRIEVDLKRGCREDAVDAQVIEALMPVSTNAELGTVNRNAREQLRGALQAALAALGTRDRLFVQHAYLDGLTLTAIGQLYQVAPSTVMRAIDRVIESLRDAMEAHLAAHHRLSGRSIDSLVRSGLASLASRG